MSELGNLRTTGPALRSSVVVAGLLCAAATVLVTATPSFANQPQPQPSPPADQSVGQDSAQTTQTSVVVVTTTIQGIRDGIQSILPTGQAGQPTQFSADGMDELGLEALGYSAKRARITSNPLYKAPPKAATTGSQVIFSGWGQTYVDHESRSALNGGVDFGRKATTFGGVGGFDVVITKVRTSNDAVVFGVLGSDMSSMVHGNDGSKTHVRGPGVGVYAAYVVGQFSVDAVYKADFLNLTRTAATPAVANLDLGMTSHVAGMNLNYKIPLQNAWWVEPTTGFSRSRQIWDTRSRLLGYVDGSEWRVQAGARAGTSVKWDKVTVNPTMGLILYSPVSIEGGSIPVAAGVPASPLDKGKLFAQGTGKLNFMFDKGLSSYIEGEVRGASGVLGTAGRVGVRKTFQ